MLKLMDKNHLLLDRSMQLNEGRFAMNGRCGYVLQPECMRNSKYNPFDKQTLVNIEPVTLCIAVRAVKLHLHVMTLTSKELQLYNKC